MATAEELLSGTSVSDTDKTLIISNDLRTIAIPPTVKCLGVENDDDVLELNFKMPRYLGNVDLSAFTIRVNYINTKGEKDTYTVNSPTVKAEYITFSWLVGPTATRYKGNTSFNVCLRMFTPDGYVDREFNTTIATLPVLEGLEADENIVAMYTDILEQWRQELFGIGDTEESSIRAVSQEERENIEQKGIEVLASIPEDYQTTFKMIDNADRTKSDAIICTSQGEEIYVSDSSDDYLRGLRIFGKSTQRTTTGAQLLDFSNISTTAGNGITCAFDESSGILTLNGTTTTNGNTTILKAFNIDMESGVYYTLSYKKIGGTLTFPNKDSTSTTKNIIWSIFASDNSAYANNRLYQTTDISAGETIKQTFTGFTSPTGKYILYLQSYYDGGIVFNNYQIQIILSEGTGAVDYEPYTGGKPSPDPDYPQDIASIENPKISVYGKNLLKNVASSSTSNGITFTVNTDGSVTVNGTATAGAWLNVSGSFTLPKGAYILSGCPKGGAYSSTYVLSATTAADYGNTKAFSLEEDTNIVVNIGVYAGCTVNNLTFYPMIRLASIEDSTYEPYEESQTVITTYTLSGVPVTSGGNYTDKNGQQWICDEIDLERGVCIQRIFSKTFTDFSEAINYNLDDNGTSCAMAVGVQLAATQGMCSCLPLTTNTTSNDRFNPMDGVIYFKLAGEFTVQELKNKLAEMAPTVVAILKTPIETPLTAEEIEVFKYLHTNFPNTTVLNNVGATMELKYNADTKTWLENLPKFTDEQVQNAVNAWLDADQTAIINATLAALPTWTGGNY